MYERHTPFYSYIEVAIAVYDSYGFISHI